MCDWWTGYNGAEREDSNRSGCVSRNCWKSERFVTGTSFNSGEM